MTMKIHQQFIVVDGPNGVGKSTIIDSIKSQLNTTETDFIVTKEPTNTELGDFIRANQNVYWSKTLAALVAADRYNHIEKLITPALYQGKIVISDRYIASSLVYQVLDGLSYEFILHLNSEIILPSLYFILAASPGTLSKRLNKRDSLTRFEVDKQADEGKLFAEAGKFLMQKGVVVHFVNNESRTTEETTREIMSKITQHLSG